VKVHQARILHVGKYYSPVKGGIEDHLQNLCEELKSRFTVEVLVANNVNKTERDIINGIKVTRVPKSGELSNIPFCPTMPIWLKRLGADIIHLHLPNPMAHLSWFIARPKGILVVTWHSDIIKRDTFMAFYRAFVMSLLGKAGKIIAASPAHIQHSHLLNRFQENAIVIPYGIDLMKFDLSNPVRNAAINLRKSFGERIVLFVGRLSYYKGVEHLIHAMEEVNANLLIVGTGQLEWELKMQARNSPAKNKVWFMGEVPDADIAAFFHACDVFVLPSIVRSEAFGIVQLEAMACGKAVVSTDLTTGVPWVNQDGKTGIVVPPRDPRSLSKAINRLLNNTELRMEYGMNGRKRVERKFTKELVAERVMDVYDEILGKKDDE